MAIGVFVPWNESHATGWIIDGNGCHIWLGSTTKGYGKVRVNGRDCLVNRLRYEREVGAIPEGMELDHYVCDNGAGGCCNPRHMRPVSHRENVLRTDGFIAEQVARTRCKNGHPLSGENLDKYELGRGMRVCRVCRLARSRAFKRAKRARTTND